MEIIKLLDKAAKKEAALERLQKEIIENNKKIKRIHSKEKILEERSVFKKIIAAGKLFQLAGILNDYDPEEVFILLKKYKESRGNHYD